MVFTHARSHRGHGHRPPAADHDPRPLKGYGPLLLVAAGALVLALAAPVSAQHEQGGARSSRVAVAGTVHPSPAGPGSVEDVTSPAAATAIAPPADLGDLGGWLDYKHRTHRQALPDEARLIYRRGLLAHQAGSRPEAVRLVRGAAELDPAFVTPHLTLASWALTRDPSQALLRYAVVLELLRRSFQLQIELVANVLFFTLHGLFVGLLVTSLVILWLHQAELRHIWRERLSRHLSPGGARAWTWVILLAPFAAGFGVALPTVIFLGMLWPLLRVRERLVFSAMLLALVAAPFAGHLLGRLANPLREERGPLYGLTALRDDAWSPSRQAAVERLAADHPDNPFVQFSLGWMARLGGDLATAETAYRRVLAVWPQDARVLNNLANVVVARGQSAPAVDLYRAAMAADPQNAAAPFNLSLIYTRQFEYRAASEAVARASALDFELVKSQQALGTEDGVLPTADQWIAPATFWSTVLEPTFPAASEAALPVAWHGRIETSGPLFGFAALVLAIAGIVVGVRWQQSIPLRLCRNCGTVVCRRCAKRRRELALCPECAHQESLAESPEFAGVLLSRLRSRSERRRRIVRTTLATLLPGYGLLSLQRVFRATLLITGAVLLSAPWLGVTPPFSFHAWPGLTDASVSPTLSIAGWFLIYANSLLGYFAQAARTATEAAAASAPVRSRPRSQDTISAKAA